MHRKYLKQYFKTDRWDTPSVEQKSMDNSYAPRYNKYKGDPDAEWKKFNEKELRYAGDSAKESVDKGLKETSKFMKDAPDGTNYSDVQSASVKWILANDTNNKELKQSAFDELTGLLSTENKEEYLKKARSLQEFVDAKDTFDYNHNNYTTIKNANKEFSVTTYDLQQFLNKEGWKDKFGNPLKEDGLYGAKTEYAHDQMLDAENAKSSDADTTEQTDKPAEPTSAQTYTQPVAPAQPNAPAPAPAQAVEPTQPAEAANPLKDALARHHESDIASRGGNTRRDLNYLQNNSNLTDTKTDFANISINHNNVVSVAENLASTITGLSEPTTIKNIIDNGYKIKTGDLGVIKADKPKMVTFVKKIAKELGLPEDLALAVVQTESSFMHWNDDGSVKTNPGTGDYGLMQINKKSHPGAYNSSTLDIMNDWQHNAIYGLTFLKMCYATALKAGFKGDDLLKATYSKYNSGNCYSFQNPNHPAYGNVLGFWGEYIERAWE